MRKNIVSILFLAAAAFSSCSDFLDVQPEGNATTDNYFNNDQQAIDAIDGIYAPLHQGRVFGREVFWEQAAGCDIVWGRTRGFNTLATLAYTGDESPIRDAFSAFYQNMARSNWTIQQLLKKQAGTPLTRVEERSLGEAYFMRGFAHFWIAYRYGTNEQGVPFVRYEDFPSDYDFSIPPQRATVMENYQLIIEDMDKAIAILPTFEEYDADNRGRAHKAAAVAYKAKVNAYWATWEPSKWSEVIELANELESQYGRGLANTFSELFSSDFADYWNREYLWSIPSTGGSTGGGVMLPGVMLENKGWGLYNGWGQIKPSYDIYEQMRKDGEGNERLVRSILEYNQEFQYFGDTRRFFSTSDIESGFQVNKYMDPFKHRDATTNGYVNTNGDWPTARVNFHILRFAEILLFRAEAYMMTGQAELAKADINSLRSRSGLQPITHTPTMADLYHERRCELAFEYADHLFDLKRWNRSSDATIKQIADSELNARPRIRKYEDRSNPESPFTIDEYEDYRNKNSYQPHMMVFPYPSEQITKSNGALTQNPGY